MIHKPILTCALLLAASTTAFAQAVSTKASDVPANGLAVFKYFGPISKMNGVRAEAQSKSEFVAFDVPTNLLNRVKPGQPVWTNIDKTKVRFIEFPLLVPKAKDCVGKGPGKGCFRMETSDVNVTATGKITGRTHLMSEDVIEGFTGAVWVLLYDREGNRIFAERGGCYGVNLREGRTEVWTINGAAETVAAAARAEVWQVKSPCSRDRWEDAMKKAEKGAEIAGKVVEVIVAAKGAKG
jgi:hypothetical protein